MGLARGFYNRFNAGEAAPEAWSDSDLQAHAHGVALGRNFHGLVAGALARRAGFWDAGGCKSNTAKSRLVPFLRTADEALVLEFADETVRVWQVDGTPLMDGPDQVEFVSPYATGDLDGLMWKQDGDLIVFTHTAGLRTKALIRSSDTSWAFSNYDFRFGPWRNRNTTATTITVTGTSLAPGESVTLAASAAVFAAGHVGGLFRFQETDGAPQWVTGGSPHGMQTWTADTDFDETIHDKCLSNGRAYKYVSAPGGTKFGTTQPIHESGTVSDGRILWAYFHDGAGIVRIDTVTDSMNAAGTVITQLPYPSATATKFWTEGAFSDYRGWPRAKPAVREERLVLGSPADEPDKWDATRTAGYGLDQAAAAYGDFKPGLGTGRVVDDDAVRRRVGEDVARIAWFETTSSLICATTRAEYVLSGATIEDPLAPASTKARQIADFGAALAMPAKAHGAILYIAANAETVRGIGMSADVDLVSQDLTVLAGHIAARKFREIVWTKQPDNQAWTRLGDGGAASFTYHAEQNVRGWNSHELALGGWSIESLCVVPGDGERDALWLSCVRTKAGEPQRRILFSSNRADKMRADAAKLYEGVAVNGVDGLDHLAGEEVLLICGPAGGPFAVYRDTVSEAGEAFLPAGVTASRIAAGLDYLSIFESLPLDLAGPGTTQMAKQNFKRAQLAITGVSFECGLVGGELTRYAVTRGVGETGALIEKRQIIEVAFDGETDREPRIRIVASGGYDFALHAIRPLAGVNA